MSTPSVDDPTTTSPTKAIVDPKATNLRTAKASLTTSALNNSDGPNGSNQPNTGAALGRQPSFAQRIVRSVSTSGKEKFQSFRARRNKNSSHIRLDQVASYSSPVDSHSHTSTPTAHSTIAPSSSSSSQQSQSTNTVMDPATSLPSKQEALEHIKAQAEKSQIQVHASPVSIDALLAPPTSTDTNITTISNPEDNHLIPIPSVARSGLNLLKVTAKKATPKIFYFIPESGQVVWNSSSNAKLKRGVESSGFSIESIREIRSGQEARPPFKISLNKDQENMCLAIIYTLKGDGMKTLYTVGLEKTGFQIWKDTLERLWEERKKLKGLEGEEGEKSGAWAKLVWSVADKPASKDIDSQGDGKLTLEEIVKMCKKLGISISDETIRVNFKRTDIANRGYLDFPQFRSFVKLLKRRPEIEALFSTLKSSNSRGLTALEFLKFMRDDQQSNLSTEQIYEVFKRFSKSVTELPAEPLQTPVEENSVKEPLLDKVVSVVDSLEGSVKAKLGMKEEGKGVIVDIGQVEAEDKHNVSEMEGKEKHIEDGESNKKNPAATTTPSSTVQSSAVSAVSSIPVGPITTTSTPPSVNETDTLSKVPLNAQSAPVLTSTEELPLLQPSSQTPALENVSINSPVISKPPASPSERSKHLVPPFRRSRHSSSPPSPSSSEPPPPPPPGIMTLSCFTSFLVSNFNTPFEENHRKVSMDMTQPLWDYFINSSHNTYLVGNQLQGESTVEGYIRALQQGGRSVEVDCWDGPDEPVVYHGRTMTTKISARDVFTAIAKYAFVASPYPVIVSLEVHCNMQQQDKLAVIMQECLGDALVKYTINQQEDDVKMLPSPEDLKYRVLIKAKNKFLSPPATEEDKTDEGASEGSSPSGGSSSDSDFKRVVSGLYNRVRKRGPSDAPKPDGPLSPPTQKSIVDAANAKMEEKGRRPSIPTSPTTTTSFSAPTLSPNSTVTKGNKPPMSFALAALLVYTVGVRGRGFNKKEHYHPTHVISIGERKLLKTVKEAKMDLISHTRTHVVRAYPAGRRFTSSNYLPVNFWSAGMQLVALNFQTFDLGMELNNALFARNGKCGYVLKPEVLRLKGKDKAALTSSIKYELDIVVLSAQQLPQITRDQKDEASYVSPYVEITIYAPGMTSVPIRKTRVIRGNGFNPTWKESFKIPFEVQAGMLDLTFFRFEVFEAETAARDNTLGCYCVCAQSLLPGYRHLPLYDQFGDEYLFSSLFIKSQILKVE